LSGHGGELYRAEGMCCVCVEVNNLAHSVQKGLAGKLEADLLCGPAMAIPAEGAERLVESASRALRRFYPPVRVETTNCSDWPVIGSAVLFRGGLSLAIDTSWRRPISCRIAGQRPRAEAARSTAQSSWLPASYFLWRVLSDEETAPGAESGMLRRERSMESGSLC